MHKKAQAGRGAKEALKGIILFFLAVIPKSPARIALESIGDMADNSKALYDYLLAHGKREYRFVWMVDEPKKHARRGFERTVFIKADKRRSLRYIYHVARCKHLFYTHRAFSFTDLKRQTVVNLTHGMPFKRGRGMLYGGQFHTHMLVTSNALIKTAAYENMTPEEKCFVAEMPRCDLLSQPTAGALKIKGEEKLIIWLPTFRKHALYGNIDSHKYAHTPLPLLDGEGLGRLDCVLGQNRTRLIIKFHPAQDVSGFTPRDYANISLYTDAAFAGLGVHLYHLLAVCDALLSDYSSVGFDFMLRRKPIGYVVDDMDEYEKTRGFCFDAKEFLAGEWISAPDALFAFIEAVASGRDPHSAHRERICAFYHERRHTPACRQVAEKFGL